MTHSQYVVQPNAFLSIAEDTRTIVFCFLHSMSIERTHRMTQYLVTDGSYITMYFTALLHAVRPSRLRRAVHGSDHALTSYYIFLCVSFVRTEHANFYIKAKTTTPEIKRCGTDMTLKSKMNSSARFVAVAAVCCAAVVQVQAQQGRPTVCPYPITYQMNRSTIIMPCNESGLTDPHSTRGWSIVDFDWSNAKDVWAKAKPMNCEEMLVEQVKKTTAASPGTTVWVYRNGIKALPWYVR